jgi:hypothetical protein
LIPARLDAGQFFAFAAIRLQFSHQSRLSFVDMLRIIFGLLAIDASVFVKAQMNHRRSVVCPVLELCKDFVADFLLSLFLSNPEQSEEI